jgi:hypothetical protein
MIKFSICSRRAFELVTTVDEGLFEDDDWDTLGSVCLISIFFAFWSL